MTANPLKGEVDLVAGEESYVLALSINEIVKLEELLDVGIVEIAAWFANPEQIRVGNMRATLWAGLQRHHPGLTLDDAGDIIAAAGLGPVVQKLGEAIQASFPEAAPAGEENPRKASRAGTGEAS